MAVIADSFTQFAAPYLAATSKEVTIVIPTQSQQQPPSCDLFADRDVVTFDSSTHLVGGSSTMLPDR